MNVNNVNDVGNNVAAQELKSYTLAALGATTDLAEDRIGAVGQAAGVAVGSVVITPTAALTASDTLFRTITINKRTAGGAATAIATITTKTTASGGTGNWTAWQPVVVTLSGVSLLALDALTIAVTHASTGTAIPASQVELFPVVN